MKVIGFYQGNDGSGEDYQCDVKENDEMKINCQLENGIIVNRDFERINESIFDLDYDYTNDFDDWSDEVSKDTPIIRLTRFSFTIPKIETEEDSEGFINKQNVLKERVSETMDFILKKINP